jgi:hypothetical protein
MLQMILKKLAVLAILAGLMGTISNAHMSDRPYGPPMTRFPSGTTVVHVVFDYSAMQNEEIRVRVYDQLGTKLFEQVEAYTGSGTKSIEVLGPGGRVFADGWYVTNLYVGSLVFPIESITWEVGPGTIPTSTPTRTPTITPTPSATPTIYLSYAPLIVKMPPTTPTPTPTSTFTPTPTSTLLPTATPTSTPTPTATPTLLPVSIHPATSALASATPMASGDLP